MRESYDLLVGADGVGSAVRSALQGHFRDMTVEVADSGREYKTYRGLRGDIEPEGKQQEWSAAGCNGHTVVTLCCLQSWCGPSLHLT